MEMIWLRVFFNVRIVSKSQAEFPPHRRFYGIPSNANLPRLVNLALTGQIQSTSMMPTKY